jgi:hypothetical protein
MSELDEIADAQQKVEFHAKMHDIYKRHLENLLSVFGQPNGNGKAPPVPKGPQAIASRQPNLPTVERSYEAGQSDNVDFLLDFVKRHNGVSQKEINDAFEAAKIPLSRNYVSNTVNRLAGLKHPPIRIEGSRKRSRIFYIGSESTNGQ